MRYEGMIYRPPSEGESLIIQTTIGCPHNRCRFCNMYKSKRFRIRKVADILQDVEEAGRLYGGSPPRTLFLADGNSVVMRTSQLLSVLRKIRETFPGLERVTAYGASQYVAHKSLEEWRELRDAGLSRIHCGMESGHDPLLRLVNKGTTMREQAEAGRLLREAGFELSMYYLAGLGGDEMRKGHAEDSAAVLNAADPDFIRIRTFSPMPGTELGDEFLQGRLKISEPHGVLDELRMLIERLTGNGLLLSDHWLNFAPVRGRLPDDRDVMLRQIDRALALPGDAFRPVGMISDSL
ncbi:MAG: radical SAM protein [Desulfovibrio sp.]|jgi:radical SAM superfamily enzyme YgiQ (UPF0313 family)|nr:radical SAM protein [Desulfovibrio sp.]